MACSITNPTQHFGFYDLIGFRDFIGFVMLCAPDSFPKDDWLSPKDYMNLDRAFAGTEYGLDLLAKDDSLRQTVDTCKSLASDPYEHYLNGRNRDGRELLQSLLQQLPDIPTR